MSLADLVEDVAALLADLDPAPAQVGAAFPTAATQLPAVVVEVSEVEEPLAGLGRLPVAAASGALRVVDTVDLAAAADLLGDDRRTLLVPHGPVVRADGTGDPPFGPADFAVTVGGTDRPVVDGTPTGQQARLRAEVGELVFAAALPPSGDVRLSYHVGLWEVRTARHRGRLDVTLAAASAADVVALSRQAESVLTARGTALLQAAPLALGPVAPVGSLAGALSRTLTLRVDYERVDPLLGGDGGVLHEVDVPAQPQLEAFVVRRRSPS